MSPAFEIALLPSFQLQSDRRADSYNGPIGKRVVSCKLPWWATVVPGRDNILKAVDALSVDVLQVTTTLKSLSSNLSESSLEILT